jgi:hypothetical protein
MAELLFQYPHKWSTIVPLLLEDRRKAEHLIQENDRALEDYLGGLGAGGVSTSVIAETIYHPVSISGGGPVSETAGVPVDGTNLKVTFTPPASGTVYITLEGCARGLTGFEQISWMILDSNQSVGAGATILGSAIWIAEADGYDRYTSRHKITGLTPGTPITVYWGHAMNLSDATPYPETLFGEEYGAAIMVVRTE